MQRADAKRRSSSDAPVWVLLAELLLRDFSPDQDWRDELAAGSLFQMLRELGMSAEGMDNMAEALAGFAKEALVHTKQGRPKFPGRIRIFCQKKIIDGANSVKSSLSPEQDKQHKQFFPDSGVSKIGGWGYFIIKRGEDLLPDSSVISLNCIDLYLYKEGE